MLARETHLDVANAVGVGARHEQKIRRKLGLVVDLPRMLSTMVSRRDNAVLQKPGHYKEPILSHSYYHLLHHLSSYK